MPTRRLALGLAPTLVAGLTLAASTATAATQPAATSSSIGLFAPDWGGGAGSRTDAQWSAAARNQKVLIGTAGMYSRHMAQLRAANPQVLILVYQLGPYTTRGSQTFSQLQSQHPDWFAHDSHGRLVNIPMFPSNYLMEMGNSGYRSWLAQQVASVVQQNGFDGAMLDSVGDGPTIGYTSAVPVNPATHQPYTTQAFLQNSVLTLNAVKASLGTKYLMFNGLHSGADYVANSHILATSHADGGMAELFLRSPQSPVTSYPSQTIVQDTLQMETDMAAHGKAFFGWCKVWHSGTSTQIAAWNTFALAVYLLGRGAASYYSFQPSHNADRTQVFYTDEQANLGAPLGGYTSSGSTYTRAFQHGRVTVNLASHSASIQVTP